MEIELAWVSDESGREFKLVPKDLVTEADAAAKAAMADSDMYASSIRLSTPACLIIEAGSLSMLAQPYTLLAAAAHVAWEAEAV